MKYFVLANREDVREIESEEQYKFVKQTLLTMGLPVEGHLPDDGFDVQHKIKLRQELRKFNVAVVDDLDSGVKVYHENNLIAEWKKPYTELKIDNSIAQRTKQLYAKINFEFWSVFEEEE